jgi:hypothetical protein
MKKVKITAVIIVSMLLGLGLSAISTAEELDGEIKATVQEYVGIVYPELCIDNTSVTFKVNITEEEGNLTYMVEDVLQIPLNVTNETGRENFVFPRSIFCSVIMRRPLLGNIMPMLPISNMIKRLFPVFKPLQTVNVLGGTLGAADDMLNITISYPISNVTFEEGENLTMTIVAMGFLPGEVNGVGEKLPIVDHKTITLEVTYEE